MNISDVGKRAGLAPKTIRFYEDIGLIQPRRSDNGYRVFTKSDLHRLVFLRRARALGFSVDECRQLLTLYGDNSRESAQVKALARAHLERVEARLHELSQMRLTLIELIDACAGDQRPDCPILADLAHSDRSATQDTQIDNTP